jgi:SAM-dependent methyltransferase
MTLVMRRHALRQLGKTVLGAPRRLARACVGPYYRVLDFLHWPMVRNREDPFRFVYQEFHRLVNAMPAASVLEIGSRNVTGVTRRHQFSKAQRYVGFDIHAGEGVDVVGDAHQLSSYFPPNSFDAVFSASVFEHLVFPWKVVLEINRVLKPGGYVFVSTHPTWPEHEMPWDFWRFPVAGLTHLFIPETGFEVVSAAEGLPCKAYSLVVDAPTRIMYKFKMSMAVASIARKVADYDAERLRWDIDVSRAVKSSYPLPTRPKAAG